MEDAHAAELSLDEGENSNAFFAVYDGHCGGRVAKFAGIHVHKRLVTEDAYREKRYEEALKRAFLGIDEDLLEHPTLKDDTSGCTATVALVTSDRKIYVANAGDSRSVMSVQGKVKPLSFDHKPSDETEKARIVGAGGYVSDRRVNGRLALSRALGDFEFKQKSALSPEKQAITADPDVTVHDITGEDEFIVLACDGIWECLSSQQVVDFVRLKVSEGHALSDIVEMLCDHCLAPDNEPPSHQNCGDLYCSRCYYDEIDWNATGIGCDNMTVLIVALLGGRTKEEWYAWVTDRVKEKYGYETPESVPRIYEESRLRRAEDRQRQQEERERRSAEQQAKTTVGGESNTESAVRESVEGGVSG